MRYLSKLTGGAIFYATHPRIAITTLFSRSNINTVIGNDDYLEQVKQIFPLGSQVKSNQARLKDLLKIQVNGFWNEVEQGNDLISYTGKYTLNQIGLRHGYARGNLELFDSSGNLTYSYHRGNQEIDEGGTPKVVDERYYLIHEVFNGDYDLYLDAYRARLADAAKVMYQELFYVELGALEDQVLEATLKNLITPIGSASRDSIDPFKKFTRPVCKLLDECIKKDNNAPKLILRYLGNGQRHLLMVLGMSKVSNYDPFIEHLLSYTKYPSRRFRQVNPDQEEQVIIHPPSILFETYDALVELDELQRLERTQNALGSIGPSRCRYLSHLDEVRDEVNSFVINKKEVKGELDRRQQNNKPQGSSTGSSGSSQAETGHYRDKKTDSCNLDEVTRSVHDEVIDITNKVWKEECVKIAELEKQEPKIDRRWFVAGSITAVTGLGLIGYGVKIGAKIYLDEKERLRLEKAARVEQLKKKIDSQINILDRYKDEALKEMNELVKERKEKKLEVGPNELYFNVLSAYLESAPSHQLLCEEIIYFLSKETNINKKLEESLRGYLRESENIIQNSKSTNRGKMKGFDELKEKLADELHELDLSQRRNLPSVVRTLETLRAIKNHEISGVPGDMLEEIPDVLKGLFPENEWFQIYHLEGNQTLHPLQNLIGISVLIYPSKGDLYDAVYGKPGTTGFNPNLKKPYYVEKLMSRCDDIRKKIKPKADVAFSRFEQFGGVSDKFERLKELRKDIDSTQDLESIQSEVEDLKDQITDLTKDLEEREKPVLKAYARCLVRLDEILRVIEARKKEFFR